MGESQIVVRLNPDTPPTGSDLSVVNAARRSFDTRSEWNWSKELESGTGDGRTLKPKDKRLLEFLARGMTAADFDEFCADLQAVAGYSVEDGLAEKLWQWRNTPTHDTPFNHAFFSFDVKFPVFVARHLVKTEYTILSETSRRYITDGIEFYEPDAWRGVAEDKKQGSGGPMANQNGPSAVNTFANSQAIANYSSLLERGVAPEQARMVLPQSMMIEATWSGTMGAFAKMCRERLASDAQYETRLVAQQVYDLMHEYMPVSTELLVKGVTE